MGENDQKPTEQSSEEGAQQQAESAEALAKELGFNSVDELKATGKGLRKWQRDLNNERQRQLAEERAQQAQPKPKASGDDDDVDLSQINPKVIKAISKIVRQEVGNDIEAFKRTTEADMTDLVYNFIERNEVDQEDLFQVMNDEELWPSEQEVNKPLLRKRLRQGLKILKARDTNEDELREKIRAEELEKLQKEGGKVVSVKPRGGGEKKTEKGDKPSTWFTRMQDVLSEDEG